MKLSGWAKYPIIEAKVFYPRNIEDLINKIRDKNAIARGSGRAYGDSAISTSNTISMKYFNRFLDFDNLSGKLVAEAGVKLEEIIEIFLTKGWFPSVSPGTKFATLGGMIAADVHGKNHHKDGSIRKFIDWLEIIRPNGDIIRCSPKENSELFEWTIGGMGLTGIILKVAIRLRKVETAWIKQKLISVTNEENCIDQFEQNLNSTYTVAWIDCLAKGKNLGKSILMLGEHAKINDLPKKIKNNPLIIKKKKKLSIPFNFPSWILSSFTVKIFYEFYYWYKKKMTKEHLIDYDDYFYPLDKLLQWNKIYGKKGFAQYQCVMPLHNAKKGIQELLAEISKAKAGSFLAVLKRFGDQDSAFSFPMKGYTLALDFPVNDKNFALMSRLDEITIKYNGRFYLAKDSRLNKLIFQKSETRIENFRNFRNKDECYKVFRSSQSQRLEL